MKAASYVYHMERMYELSLINVNSLACSIGLELKVYSLYFYLERIMYKLCIIFNKCFKGQCH